jgi:transcriptional regulator with XRE-family HTH domain
MKEREELRKEVGERLTSFRKAKGLTVYKAATRSGLSIGQIHAIEEGSKNYTIDSLFAYCDACNVHITLT